MIENFIKITLIYCNRKLIEMTKVILERKITNFWSSLSISNYMKNTLIMCSQHKINLNDNKKNLFFFKIKKLFVFNFDWIIVNEIHFKNTKNVITINLIRIFNEKMQESWFLRKWFFIDTSFERDLKQIVY